MHVSNTINIFNNIIIVSETTVTDYNIYLVNTAGYVTMASSTLSSSNVEMIRYHVELSGNL